LARGCAHGSKKFDRRRFAGMTMCFESSTWFCVCYAAILMPCRIHVEKNALEEKQSQEQQ
jgi:hypothetical protein